MRLASVALVTLEKVTMRLSQSDRMELGDHLAHIATQLARVSAYMSRRNTGGKHADAVRAQNQAARKVRQALGFTYGNDQIHF